MVRMSAESTSVATGTNEGVHIQSASELAGGVTDSRVATASAADRPELRSGSAAVELTGGPSDTKEVDEDRSGRERALSRGKTCPACGAVVDGGRPDRRHCSARCRARASRERKTLEIEALLARLRALG